MNILNVFNAVILAYASWKIRKTISNKSTVLPNQKLLRLHVGNSIIYAVLWTIESTIL